MIGIYKISMLMIAFGGLIYSATSYYLPIITNPSWPFFIIGYGLTSFFIIPKFSNSIRLGNLIFILFVFYLVVSFSFLGMSSKSSFYYYLILFIILPFLSGKILGEFIQERDFRSILMIGMLSFILIIYEILINPNILLNDRLILFQSNDLDGAGAGSIGININFIFGAIAIGLFNHLIIFKRSKIFIGIIFFLASAVIIIAFGSRSAIFSLISSLVIALVLKNSTNLLRLLLVALTTFLIIFIVSFAAINFLSSQRLELLQDIPRAISNASALFGCNLTLDGSVIARIILWFEGLNMLLNNIVFGVGSSNYGYFYCGDINEFASPHMFILHVASELGLIGVIIYLLFIFSILKHATHANIHHESPKLFFILIFWIYITLISQINGNYFYDFQWYLISALVISISWFEENARPDLIKHTNTH